MAIYQALYRTEGYEVMKGEESIGMFETQEKASAFILEQALKEIDSEEGLILDYDDGTYLEVIPTLGYAGMEVVERLSDGENVMWSPNSGYSIWLDIMIDCSRVGYKFDGDFDEYADGFDE